MSENSNTQPNFVERLRTSWHEIAALEDQIEMSRWSARAMSVPVEELQATLEEKRTEEEKLLSGTSVGVQLQPLCASKRALETKLRELKLARQRAQKQYEDEDDDEKEAVLEKNLDEVNSDLQKLTVELSNVSKSIDVHLKKMQVDEESEAEIAAAAASCGSGNGSGSANE